MKKLRSLRRISHFIEAMGQIEQLVQIFLNVSNVVAFVWGPIKLSLLLVAARVESLECLLDTYVEVGEIIPSLQQYDQLFKAAPCVLEVLEKYFCDILEFHQNALSVFARPAWTKFFDATWKTFKTNFKPILESLRRHRALLHDLKLDAACLEIQVSRSQILGLVQKSSDRTLSRVADMENCLGDTYRKLSDKVYDLSNTFAEQRTAQRDVVHLQQVSAIIDKLGHPHVEEDQYNALNLCHKQSRTVDFPRLYLPELDKIYCIARIGTIHPRDTWGRQNNLSIAYHQPSKVSTGDNHPLLLLQTVR